MCFSSTLLRVAAIFALLLAPWAQAQNTRMWTGLAKPDNNWTTPGNWNGAVPVSGDTALFAGFGNVNRNISLGGATRPINTIRFDNISDISPYTVGVLGSSDTFDFDPGGAISLTINSDVVQTINANIHTNGSFTITNGGEGLVVGGAITIGNGGLITIDNDTNNRSITLAGNIGEDAGMPASLKYLTSWGGKDIILSGTNTYSGPTTVQLANSSGSLQFSTNSPFGSGTLNVVGTGNGFLPLTDGLVIANAININGSVGIGGTNSTTWSGPIKVVGSSGGGTAWSISNTNTTTNRNVVLGSSPGSSTITLGNPAANGGDNIGRSLNLYSSKSVLVVNDVIQDPALGGGTASGSVRFSGANSGNGGSTYVTNLNTYTGPTYFDNYGIARFDTDFHVGETKGPFGIGTLIGKGGNLQPIGDRTLEYPITLDGGLFLRNATGDTSNLTLTGPITVVSGSLGNNSGGGKLTLGSAASPSTITIPSTFGPSFSIAVSGPIVLNDVIQDTSKPNASQVYIGGTSRLTINSQNTYSCGTQLTSPSTIIGLGTSSIGLPGAITSGPFGTASFSFNNSETFEPIGADQVIANGIGINHGIVVENASLADDPTGPHNLTFIGPIGFSGLDSSLTNNMVPGVAFTLGSTTQPSTVSLASTLTIKNTVGGGGTTIINDAISGVGGISVQNGATAYLNGTNSYSGTTTVQSTGKLFVNGANIGTNSVQVNSGVLGGTGSIAGQVNNFATIAPGSSIGTLTIGGNVTMNTNSHLAIELDGGTSDKLVVGGNLNLSSVDFLDVSGIGSGPGWVIATYGGTLTGTFNNITPGYTLNYGTGTNSQITLIAPPSGVAGDFNNDGKVDAADYVVWRKNVGTTNILPNDPTGGTIGTTQYNTWRAHFGQPAGSGAGANATAAVPEPATLVLLIFAVAGCCLRRGRAA